MKDLRQSSKYGQYMERIGWQTEKITNCQVFIREIPIFGSVIKTQRCSSLNLDQFDQLVKLHRAFLVSVEPASEKLVPELLKNSFRLSPDGMIPSQTRQIDLTPDEQTIFQSFNRTRKYKIGKARRNKFLIKINNGAALSSPRKRGSKPILKQVQNDERTMINGFISLWHKNALERGFWVPIKNQIKAMYESFGEDTYLLGAYSIGDLDHPGNLLAGILLLINKESAHYFYAASSPKGRSLCAPSLLTWEAIKLAKSKSCKIFDFEGINDPRFPKKGWDGFSYFKESFGGKVVTFPGRYIKTYGLLPKLLFH